MTDEMIIQLVKEALLQVLTLAAPILGISMLVGLVISIFQTTTSIQEQTLTFVPKIFTIFLSIMFFAGWLIMNLTNFTITLYERIPYITR